MSIIDKSIRVTRRSFEEMRATVKIAKVTSWKEAITTFRGKIDIQRCVRNPSLMSPQIKKRLDQKHDIMIRYFSTIFHDFLQQYNFDRTLEKSDSTLHNCIWMCWWQGLENAPQIVKKCVQSVKDNAVEHKVIVIDEKNYSQYVDIPQWFLKKKDEGIISKTHFADLLRLSLLSRYGGMWLDATFFCTSKEIDQYFGFPVWSIKRPDYLNLSISSGYFATYALQCNYEYRWIFRTVRDFFLHYWETNDILIDYLTLDYMIVLAQEKDCRIKECFLEILPNNPACEDLLNSFGKEYDDDLWKRMKKETALFKLTWKVDYPKETNGKQTFYSQFMKNKL